MPLTPSRRARFAAATVLTALAFGTVASPAWAAPGADEVAPAVTVESINAQLVKARDAAASASLSALSAAEDYRLTEVRVTEGQKRVEALGERADAAEAVAELSRDQAGRVAAAMAKGDTAGASAALILAPEVAPDFLNQLGTLSKLSEGAADAYEAAEYDLNQADALRDHARAQAKQLRKLNAAAKKAAEAATTAAADASAAVLAETLKSSSLFAQLAALKGTTVEAEREAAASLESGTASKDFRAAQARAAKVDLPPGQMAGKAEVTSTAPAPSIVPPAVTVAPEATVAPTQSAPVPTVPPAAAPVPGANAVSVALAFASAQLGKPYVLGGAGPDVWDCSGLTKKAYAAAGIYIGTHSATNQYHEMVKQGKMVSLADAQVGDLLFWGEKGDYYHVAIYVGDGLILEAPNPSQPVRVHSVWSAGELAPVVGRPSS